MNPDAFIKTLRELTHAASEEYDALCMSMDSGPEERSYRLGRRDAFIDALSIAKGLPPEDIMSDLDVR